MNFTRRHIPLIVLAFCVIHLSAHAATSMADGGITTTGSVSASNAYFAGNVGVGVVSPTTQFQVSGTMRVQSADALCNIGGGMGLVSCSSDRRLKKDIVTIPSALEKVSKMRGVTFHWKNPAANQREHLGVIAQEVQAVFPQAVSEVENGTLTVDYAVLVAPLIESIKELKTENDDLRRRLEALEAKVK